MKKILVRIMALVKYRGLLIKDEELKGKIKQLKKYKVSNKKIKKLENEIKELKELKEEIEYLKFQLIRKSDHIE